MKTEIKKSLGRRVAENVRIMVIGSMPGEESLRRQQYYAHPRNNFWKFIAQSFTEINEDTAYEERIALLLKQGVGLWDVMRSCRRNGSLDSNIKDVVANDFSVLSKETPQLRKLLFNGNKAYEAFMKSPNRVWAEQHNIELVLMPSTSPANASQSFDWKLETWRRQLQGQL